VSAALLAVNKHVVKFVTEPSPVECRKNADVVFVIDSTSNLLGKDFQLYILGTVADIIRRLDVGWVRTRVAALHFTNTAKVQVHSIYTIFELQDSNLHNNDYNDAPSRRPMQQHQQ